MRRFYVLPQSVWAGKIQIGIHHTTETLISAVTGKAIPSTDGTPIYHDVVQLFHPIIGSHYIDLPGGMILLCTSFDHNEIYEDLFHAMPEVAILPHPTTDGTKPLSQHVGSVPHKFTAMHLKALMDNPDMGIVASDSVLDVAKKASKIHPEVKIRHTL